MVLGDLITGNMGLAGLENCVLALYAQKVSCKDANTQFEYAISGFHYRPAGLGGQR